MVSLKPLTLDEIERIRMHGMTEPEDFARFAFTAREYHRLREVIKKAMEAFSRVPLDSDGNLEEGESLLHEALKASGE